MSKKQPMSQDPKVRADRVNANAVYLKPSLYKMLSRTQEMVDILYEKQFGKKFTSEYDKKAKSDDSDV
tara:strand:+ start:263 stop:466 length:204 start_codon:yes stop_codon:yes gene_type:complete